MPYVILVVERFHDIICSLKSICNLLDINIRVIDSAYDVQSRPKHNKKVSNFS